MKFLVGIDEAGRGPIAGPVAVGVVMVAHDFDVAKEFPGVGDSKKLSEKKREEIYGMLETRAAEGRVCFRVEFESAEYIDAQGIAPAVSNALSKGLSSLSPDPTQVHVQLDGALHAPSQFSQETIIHGDALVPLISLASIAAKVERDRLMVALSEKYPAYGFEKHKGYGTRAHYEMIVQHGLCPIHRRTFLRSIGAL